MMVCPPRLEDRPYKPCPVTGRMILDEIEVPVLSDNWETVQVFQNCQMTFAGMGQPIGISALEATCAMHALGVPRSRRAEVLSGVRYMGEVAAQAISERTKETPPPAPARGRK